MNKERTRMCIRLRRGVDRMESIEEEGERIIDKNKIMPRYIYKPHFYPT